MELNKFDSLKDLNTRSYDWNCRLRLQSLWKAMNKDTKVVWGVNMVFTDDSNCRIHAYASAKNAENFGIKLNEGEIYCLSHFKVKQYLGDETFRVVRNDKHIFFTGKTKISEDCGQGLKIEKHAFDLFNLQDMKKLSDDNRFLIDVVGLMQNFQPHYTGVVPTEEKPKVKFELSDGRSSVKVTLFDKFGIDFEDAIANIHNREIYVILAFAKIGKYEGEPNLSNYAATRVYINPIHYCIKALRKRFSMLARVDERIVQEEQSIEVMNVNEIKLLRGARRQTKVKCEVTVRKVDDQVGWYLAKCTGCGIEIHKEGKHYKCNKCNRIIPYPDKRFRVCTICSDSTGTIGIIFPDSEICRLLDQTVFDLETKAIEDNEEGKFPEILKQMQKHSYSLILELSLDNLNNGSTVFHACSIVNVPELTGDFDPTKKPVTEGISTAKESIIDDHMKQTPPTGNSSTKSRARNIDTISFGDIEEEGEKQSKNRKSY